MARSAEAKSLTLEEGLYAAFLVVLTLICLVIAGKAYDQVIAFHAVVGAAFSALGVFLIFRGYFARPGGAVPQVVDGTPNYNYGPIKFATIAAMFWGIAGFIVGDYLAWELAFPALNMDLSFLNFGRLRPLHTSAVIFAFGGNVLLGTSFYVVQRTSQARMPGIVTPWFVILGYNAFIVIAGTGYLLGVTQGKEYAEPEWYADLWLTVVWVVYLLLFLGTLWKRRDPHIYVANWFYLAFIVTIAMLHLGNNV
jgi:cytochrome c oxidase cbb3-type subunit 1